MVCCKINDVCNKQQKKQAELNIRGLFIWMNIQAKESEAFVTYKNDVVLCIQVFSLLLLLLFLHIVPQLYKRNGKPKRQSKIDNSEIHTTQIGHNTKNKDHRCKNKTQKTKQMRNTYPPKLNKKFGVNSSSLERSISDSYKPPTVLFIVQSRKKSRP